MPSYISTFFSGSVDPFWPHFILLGCAIIGGIAVGLGIIMESEKWSLATILVVIGVATEAVFTIMLFLFDEGISSAQQSKITDLDTQLVARTKELLEVRKLTADRNLSKKEGQSLTELLSSFAGQQAKIVIFPVNFEASFVADEIYGAMLNARWVVDPPEKLSKPPNDMLTQGVTIIPSEDIGSENAADTLFKALNSTGIGANEARGNNPYLK